MIKDKHYLRQCGCVFGCWSHSLLIQLAALNPDQCQTVQPTGGLRNLATMKARQFAACVIAAGAFVSGCQSTVPGTPEPNAGSPTEPSFPTPKPSRSAPSSPTAAVPASPTGQPPPGAQVLAPQNGYVFIETKSGKTRCQINADSVGCEAQFTNSPVVDGGQANGVNLTSDGQLKWILGNLGDIPVVTIDYRTYEAEGWTIVATEQGTRFTNDRTSHGMFVSIDKVDTY
jgi:hypothetical protein